MAENHIYVIEGEQTNQVYGIIESNNPSVAAREQLVGDMVRLLDDLPDSLKSESLKTRFHGSGDDLNYQPLPLEDSVIVYNADTMEPLASMSTTAELTLERSVSIAKNLAELTRSAEEYRRHIANVDAVAPVLGATVIGRSFHRPVNIAVF